MSGMKIKSMSTSKTHFERQLIKDLRDRLYLYLLSTKRSGMERIKIIKHFEDIPTKEFDIAWAGYPSLAVVKLMGF